MKPVQATRARDNVYRVLERIYDSNIETWEFSPGDQIIKVWEKFKEMFLYNCFFIVKRTIQLEVEKDQLVIELRQYF